MSAASVSVLRKSGGGKPQVGQEQPMAHAPRARAGHHGMMGSVHFHVCASHSPQTVRWVAGPCGMARDAHVSPGFHPHLAPGRIDDCYVSLSAWIDLIPRRKFKTLGWGGVTLRRKNGRDLRKIVREWRCGAVCVGPGATCEAFVVAAQSRSAGVMHANPAKKSVKKALDSGVSSRL